LKTERKLEREREKNKGGRGVVRHITFIISHRKNITVLMLLRQFPLVLLKKDGWKIK
jgi:hypothetical protein